jgi:2-hydroxychromene-2-carboxylate isomerase
MRIPLPALNSAFGSDQKGRIEPEVRFYFDIVCPYAYLASLQLPALCERLGARIDYRPILLGGVLKALQSEPSAGPAARQAYTRLDLLRWAERLAVPLRFPAEHPRRTVQAMRLLCWAPRAARADLVAALYRAYWVEGRDTSSLNELGAIAASVGLSATAAIAGLQAPAAAHELRQRTDEALQAGVFGVPTFIVDSHSGPRLFFGQDRLHFVEEALLHHPHAEPGERARRPPPQWGEQHLPVANQAREVTFVYDFASPFAYLASTQIEELAARCGAVLKWHPILLGGLFRSIGTPNVPIATYPEPKRKHSLDDMARWAHYYDQPFHFPSRFPMVTVTALRLALLAGEQIGALSRALFTAYWVGDADLNDPGVLVDALKAAGLPETLLLRVAEPQVKQQLLDNNAAAERAGVFGVPSFLVPQPSGPPALYFGQDRLPQLERALVRGTSPSPGC